MEGIWVPEYLGVEQLPHPQPQLGWLDTDVREAEMKDC